MTHAEHVAQLDAQIAALEATRGTPQEPIALGAQISLLQRKRQWHVRRLAPRNFNTGQCSLHPPGSAGAGVTRRLRNRFNERPLVELPEAGSQPV